MYTLILYNYVHALLEKICTKLEQHNIPYMLSGSLVMLTYTTPRMTRDIDIVINIQSADLDKFLDIFKEGYYRVTLK